METPSSVSPENAGGPFSFKVGEEGFGFDGGFTEGKFTGMIRGTDGKEFAGLVEDLGGGRYRIEDYEGGRIIDTPVETGPVVAEAPVGGLEDAAAVAAMEEPVGGKGDDFGGYRLAPEAKGGIVKKDKLIGEIIGPDGQRFVGIVKLTPEGLKVVGVKGAEGLIKTPGKEIVGRSETPPAEVSAVPSVAATAAEADLTPSPAPEPQLEIGPTFEQSPAPEPAPLPETAAVSVEAGQRSTVAEARQEFDKEFKDIDARFRQAKYEAERKADLEKQAQQLRIEAETARSSVNRLRNKDRIDSAISEEGRLIAEAKKLESQAAAINALEQDQIRAIEDRRQRTRDLTQEVDRWGNLIENPALIEEYRGLDGRMQADLTAAEKLFGGGNPEDQQVLDAARKRIEARTQVRRTELEAMFPRRYMELAGMAPRRDLPDASIDYTLDRDLIERYYQFADQFYAELTGGPQAAEVPQPEVEPQPAPESVEPPAVEQPVVETVAEEMAAEPEVVVGQPEEVPLPPVEEQLAEPVEAPAEAAPAAEVVTDAEEQARVAAARPAEIPAEEKVEAPTPTAEAAAETPEQIFERRKQGFAGALAGLDRARSDTSGTEGEQKVRLAEAYNQAIGAAMEFMNEGDGAREVVREFLAGALGTSGGRKLTEVAVRSRMDEAGVLQAATPEERKKKLEQAGLWGLLELLLELGMSFTDKTIGAVVSEVQSATGAGR